MAMSINGRHQEILEGRGLDIEWLETLGVRSCDRPLSDAIAIPYYRGDTVVGVKYRTLGENKRFMQKPGSEQIFYNWNCIAEPSLAEQPIIITEGECLSGDTEVLTKSGWVALSDYRGGEVAQWSVGNVLEWIVPTAKVERDYVGDMIEFTDRFVRMAVTPLHRMPGLDVGGRLSFQIAEMRAAGRYRHHRLPRSGVLNGSGIDLSDDQLALALAVSADATIDVRKMTARQQGGGTVSRADRYARIAFSKKRKIERLRGILDRLGLQYTETTQPSNQNMRFFGISLPDWIPGRMLPWEWITSATIKQREFLLGELRHWDGNEVPDRTMHEFATKHSELAEFIQTLCHTSGRCSTIVDRSNDIGRWLKVSVLHGKSDGTYQQLKGRRYPFGGKVYCLTVRSGMFLARYQQRIFVTGNCDCWSALQSGFDRTVSVPGGAPGIEVAARAAMKYDFLQTMPEIPKALPIILATDADGPGEALRADLAFKLGHRRCKAVRYPKGCKDLNDALRLYGPRGVVATINNAQWMVGNLYRMADIPMPPEATPHISGFPGLDEHYRLRLGDFCVVTGIPSTGKTTFVDDLACRMAMRHKWPICICTFEQSARDIRRTLRSWYAGCREVDIDDEMRDKADAWINQMFSFIVVDDDSAPNLAWIMDRFMAAVLRYGTRMCIIDPWNELEHDRPDGMTLTEYVGASIREIKAFAKRSEVHFIVVAHPAKMRRENGKYPIPTLYDISDSAHWANKPDVGVIVHRSDGGTTVRVVKSRYHDQIGTPGEAEVKYIWQRATYEAANTPDAAMFAGREGER